MSYTRLRRFCLLSRNYCRFLNFRAKIVIPNSLNYAFPYLFVQRIKLTSITTMPPKRKIESKKVEKVDGRGKGNAMEVQEDVKTSRGRGKKTENAAKPDKVVEEMEETVKVRKGQKKEEAPVEEPKTRGRKAKVEKEAVTAPVSKQSPSANKRGRKPKATVEEQVSDADDNGTDEPPIKKLTKKATKVTEAKVEPPVRGRRGRKAKTAVVAKESEGSEEEAEEEQIDKKKRTLKQQPKATVVGKESEGSEEEAEEDQIDKKKKRNVKQQPKAVVVAKESEGSEEEAEEEQIDKKKKRIVRQQPKAAVAEKGSGGSEEESDEEQIDKKKKRNVKQQPIAVVAVKNSSSEHDSDDEKIADKKKNLKKDDVEKNTTETNYENIDFFACEKNPKGQDANVKIASWNIGGIRAWLKKDGMQYITNESPDILCLQETKCSEKKLPEDFVSAVTTGGNNGKYHMYWLDGEKDGYAGVAMFTRTKPLMVFYGIENEEMDKESRCITAHFQDYYVINVYVPNAGRGLVTLSKRLEWNEAFRSYVKRLDAEKPVIICGDMNVAHNEIDLKNAKTNKKNAGFTPEEREGFTTFLSDGYEDVYRKLYPDEKDCYTFWSYMSNARNKNIGWRLDYFMVSTRFMENVCDSKIRNSIYGSDHCPLTLHFNCDM